jgi:hypothetical protein
VSIVLDRYGHLLPGSEIRVNQELDRMAKGFALADRRRTILNEGLTEQSTSRNHEFLSESFARVSRARKMSLVNANRKSDLHQEEFRGERGRTATSEPEDECKTGDATHGRRGREAGRDTQASQPAERSEGEGRERARRRERTYGRRGWDEYEAAPLTRRARRGFGWGPRQTIPLELWTPSLVVQADASERLALAQERQQEVSELPRSEVVTGPGVHNSESTRDRAIYPLRRPVLAF